MAQFISISILANSIVTVGDYWRGKQSAISTTALVRDFSAYTAWLAPILKLLLNGIYVTSFGFFLRDVLSAPIEGLLQSRQPDHTNLSRTFLDHRKFGVLWYHELKSVFKRRLFPHINHRTVLQVSCLHSLPNLVCSPCSRSAHFDQLVNFEEAHNLALPHLHLFRRVIYFLFAGSNHYWATLKAAFYKFASQSFIYYYHVGHIKDFLEVYHDFTYSDLLFKLARGVRFTMQ